MNSVVINTGELYVGRAPLVLLSYGIGSCVVVCIYDQVNKLGGLAHTMLPNSLEHANLQTLEIEGQAQFQPSQPAKYVDLGLDQLVGKIINLGANPNHLTARIIGGAEMFTFLKYEQTTLGSRNLQAVKQKLQSMGIKIILEDVGGNLGRSISFSLDSGQVDILKKL